MNDLINSPWVVNILTCFFLLAPIALTINLVINQNRSNSQKKIQVSYIYAVIWAIAFFSFFLVFIQG